MILFLESLFDTSIRPTNSPCWIVCEPDADEDSAADDKISEHVVNTNPINALAQQGSRLGCRLMEN